MAQERNTEEEIIIAAKKVFVQKGLSGARMQDIADEAGINKAMLHYYYRSKEKLFEIVFHEALDKLISRLSDTLNSERPFDAKIKEIVNGYIDGLTENPHVPLFVLNELNQNPERLIKRFKSRPAFPAIQQFLAEIGKAGEKGIIKKINPVQLLLNVLSMCVFPFVARPLVQAVTDINDAQFMAMIEERRKVVANFVLDALKPQRE
jgi:TetR/AcrR family transcriptional regulator